MRKSFLLLAMLCSVQFSFSQAIEGMDSLLARLARRNNDSTGVDNMYNVGLLYNMHGRSDSALYYYRQMLELSERIDFDKGICMAQAAIGDVYIIQTRYEEAMNQFIEALKVAERSNNLKMQGFIKRAIGAIYLLQDRPDLAEKNLLEAERIMQARKDTMGLLVLMPDIANCYESLGDKAKGWRYIEKGYLINEAFSRNENMRPTYREAMINNKLTLGYIGLNFITTKEMAIKGLERNEPLWNKIKNENNSYHRQLALNILADLHLKAGNYKEAGEYAEQSLKEMVDHEDYSVLKDLYDVMGQSAYAQGQYQKAYDNLKLYTRYSDSLYKIENRQATQSVEARYETAKKEKEIAVLNEEKRGQRIITGISIAALIIVLVLLFFVARANRLQKRLFAKEKEIQKKEMEKRMFELEQTALRAQMNPHFIFNSLNSVQRFVINNDAEGVNHYLSTFANLIRQTLENSGKQLIPLKDEVRYLETYLRLEQMRGNEKFRYTIKVNPDVDTEETYIPNMIIQPYLENSVIHGMAGKKGKEGVINLTISKNHKLTCMVEDNGAGIHASKTFKKAGESEYESMGTAITEKRIEMFNTVSEEKIELQVLDKSELGNNESGTRIMIKFPINSSN